MAKRELLFSITKKDLRLDYYKASGAGGQKKNKTSSACRITHSDSGAVGNCSEHRGQAANKKEAFRRLVASDKFKKWHKVEVARVCYGKDKLERETNTWVEEQMKPKHLKIESFMPQ